MIKVLFFMACLLPIFYACSSEQKAETPSMTNIPEKVIPTEPKTTETPNYTYAIFLTDSLHQNLGFGYNVIIDGKTFIHQPNIPSIAGNNGFKTKEQAEILAKYIIYKLSNNMMPPSVTPKELDSLGIFH